MKKLIIILLASIVNVPKSDATSYELDSICSTNLSCLADKFKQSADRLCSPKIIESARYTHEWIDGILFEKFSKYEWLDMDKGLITYIGDRLKFVNSYSAHDRIIYECDFDTQYSPDGRVIDVRIKVRRIK